ncbi:MAG: twin-arginine translocase TatA/TatE family subunit [Chloroflexi bacterium]|nr:MAG: twin-arginine translocase TatA/TatE family subunit [Chloroflexota bacterium]TME03310.1 MAG: twin-arginine translocase TatA/TatE family subunit [Chloroflexota bacterium]
MPIHPFWIAAILIIVLIVFGPSRLPELGSAVGKAMREFRKATTELTNEVRSSATAEPPKPEPAKVEATSASSEPKTASDS